MASLSQMSPSGASPGVVDASISMIDTADVDQELVGRSIARRPDVGRDRRPHAGSGRPWRKPTPSVT